MIGRGIKTFEYAIPGSVDFLQVFGKYAMAF